MADVIVRVKYEGQTYDLDIDNSIPLRLDVSAVENQSIGSFYGVGSQTFDLPGTKNNNRFFKHGYTIGTQDIPAFYTTIQAYVIYNGETLLEGQLQLLEAITDANGYVTYKVQVTDSVIQFKDAIATKLITNADWSAYNHTLTSQSIVDSWEGTLLSGSVFYPIVDYGTGQSNDWPAIPRVALGTTPGFIGNATTPMSTQQFLPAIKVKDTLDVIFNQVGYKLTGSFIETEDFNKLYILPKSTELLGVGSGIQNTFNAGLGINQYLGAVNDSIPSITAVVEYGQENSDPGNNYNPLTYTYTCPITGEYAFGSTIRFNNPANAFGNVYVELKIKKDGVTQAALGGLYTPSDPV